jgi:aryl-alcohol dehydrogenase-like predicted oxidoreductase
VTSSIIGATSVQQLAINLAAAELELDAQVLDDIQSVHRRHPLPY